MSFSLGLGGLRLSPGYLDRDGQAGLLAAVRGILADAPLFVPRMPKSGRAFTVRIRRPWPPIPAALLTTWHELARYPDPPQACLINFYGPGAKMGLHQDRDEADFDAPVVSVSLGNSCLFRVGRLKRNEPTPVHPAWFRRRGRSRRRCAACLSRGRSDLSGHIALAPRGGTDQSNSAPGYPQRSQ